MYLDRCFAGSVTVEYEDAAMPGVADRHAALLRSVPEGYLIYPLVAINDEIAATGGIDVYGIYHAVSEALHHRPQPGQMMG